MTEFDPVRHKAATAVFKLAVKTLESGMHRTVNREPKGTGWVDCKGVGEGFKCKPAKVREAIEYFKIAYEVFPDIVALNQIALAHGMIGEEEQALDYFGRMKQQAQLENNDAYIHASDAGLERCN